MKKKHLTAFVFASVLMAGALAFMLTSTPQAADGTIQANVSVATVVTVTGVDALVFGLISAPSTGTEAWTVNAANGPLVKSGASSSADLDLADHSRGSFTVSGDALASVAYSCAVTTNFSDANLSLLSCSVSPASPTALSGTGALTVLIGGQLQIGFGAAPGLHADAVVTLSADYTP